MVSTANPDGAVIFQLVSAEPQPFHVERHHFILRHTLVTLTLVHAHDLSALQRYATVGEEVGWVGEYHVELEIELFQQFDTVAVKKGESMVGRTEERSNFIKTDPRKLLRNTIF